MSQVDILEIFHQAWLELYCPPVRLSLDKKGDRFDGGPPLSVSNGAVRVRPSTVPPGCDPLRFILWMFRHELAHVHHCPYDMRTAYSLERAAHEIVSDWSMAYLATYVFSDIEVNINYLSRRFEEVPYFLKIIGVPRNLLADEIAFEIYNQMEPIVEPRDRAIAEAARETLTIMRLNKPWHTKVQMLAIILDRLKARSPRLFSKQGMTRLVRNRPLLVREDFLPDTLRNLEETYGTISSEKEAREFFKYWVEPRISEQEKERLKGMMKEKLKTKRGGSRHKEEEKMKGRTGGDSSKKTYQDLRSDLTKISVGDEPDLPTSLSKPYEKILSNTMEEALWKRYWYKSRADNTIIRYLSESPNLRPVWSVMKYPDEWHIEDEIEALDIEMSLDEGPLIPEVNTLKWVEEASVHGQSIISGFVPSSITVLDASQSMSRIHDTAAIAAFIAYLSALKAGGQTATVTFSTNYVTADWNSENEFKELTLSMSFDEFTVFPAFEIMRLVSTSQGNCFIVIITDGGWQNIDEAVPLIEQIADRGHKVFIFQLPGGEYPDKIGFMKRSPYLEIHKVDNPEADLQGLLLSETMKTYKTFLT